MEEKIKYVNQKCVGLLVDLPVRRKVMATRWVYQLKTRRNGHIERYTARPVANGFSKKTGTDLGTCMP